MLDIIAETYPRLVAALRRQGVRKMDAAELILAARHGALFRAASPCDCLKARILIERAFRNRGARLRLSREG